MTRVMVSVPWTWDFESPDGPVAGCDFDVIARSSDWGLGRTRSRLRLARDTVRIIGRCRQHDVVVLSTLGAEAAVIAGLLKCFKRQIRVLVFDFLAPHRTLPRRTARALFRAIDGFLVIRRGDSAMLERRYDVSVRRTRFIRWPTRLDRLPAPATDGGYVYAAGWAHRDWDTLVAALCEARLPAVLAPGHTLALPPDAEDFISVIEMPSPARGREFAAGARLVAAVMKETELPSGPLVLLDAMGMGKAVVASDVNGTRDYVRAGETALVVRPGDSAELAAALRTLWDDDALRVSLATNARAELLERGAVPHFWKNLSDACR